MSRLHPVDPGEPGTARHRRVAELQGRKQSDLADSCAPKSTQAALSQFERAENILTWQRARQFSAAYYPEIFHGSEGRAGNPGLAALLTWRLWFATVAVHGSPSMRALAERIKPSIEAQIFTRDLTLWDLVARDGRIVSRMLDSRTARAEGA